MNVKSPLVTVITGYYNRPENLRDSVFSILNQTYNNFEYIVFDDNSTDETVKLLEEIDHPKFRLLKYDINMGFTKGMIKAVSEARGSLIAIHGAGDISYPERIKKQVDVLLNNQSVGLVGCMVEDVGPDKTSIFNKNVKNSDEIKFTGGEILFRKELYYRAGGYNPLFYFGQLTSLKIEILKFSNPAFVKEVLYKRIHYANGVTKNPSKMIRQQILYTWGADITRYGLMNVDLSKIVLEKTLKNVELLTPGSNEEKFFLKHSNAWIFLVYQLYKIKLLPKRVPLKIASLLKQKRLKSYSLN